MHSRTGRRVFVCIFLFSLVFSAVYLTLRRGEGFEGFVYAGGTSVFGDFINNLHYPTHEGGPYFDSCWASFPPFAYTFYYLLNVAFTRANYHFELLAYAVITAVTCMLMLYAVQRIFKQYSKKEYRPREPMLLTLCLLLSGVMIYTVERGNSALNVLVMVLFAFSMRDSESAWEREAALLLIAVAANFKLYPCIFGLLYLFEKRYKEALRLVVYGVVLFVVPFAWFGGLDGFKQFLLNQQEIQASRRNDYFTSIPSIASYISAELGWNADAALSVGWVLSGAIAVALLLCICIEKRLWLRVMLMVSLFTIVPGWSAEYMAIYMALPFLLCYCEGGDDRWHVLYMSLFAGVFILLPFAAPIKAHTVLSCNMLVSFGALYLITLTGMLDTLTSRFRRAPRPIKAEEAS